MGFWGIAGELRFFVEAGMLFDNFHEEALIISTFSNENG